MAAANEIELIRMIKTSLLIDDRPCSFRFPRGSCLGLEMPENILPLDIGKGEVIQEGQNIALLNFGARLSACKEVAVNLNKKGINITLIDAKFAKPLDTKLIDLILDNHEYLLTVEEGSIGGFSSLVLDYVHNKRNKTIKSKINNIIFPDIFIDHDTVENQYKIIGMDSKSIENKILSFSNNIDLELKKIKNL